MTLIDTIIRLEHLPCDAPTGAALEFRIKRMEYFDDLTQNEPSPGGEKGVFEPPAVAVKNIQLFGVTVLADEYTKDNRTFTRADEVGCGTS